MNLFRNFFKKRREEPNNLGSLGKFVPKSDGKRYVIPDTHGCVSTLKALLEKINFKNSDQLFLLGDYIDRGPDSVGIVDFLIELNQAENVFLLRGNHEEELLLLDKYKIEHIIKSNMQKNKLKGFYTKDLNLKKKYKLLFESLHYFVEFEDFILVHAGFDFDLNRPFEDIDSMVGIRNWYYDQKKAIGKKIVFGHSVKSYHEIVKAIESNEKQIPLDNGCVYNDFDDLGHLLCLCLDDLKLYSQKNIDIF